VESKFEKSVTIFLIGSESLPIEIGDSQQL